ncbi:hypothetical protein Q1M64_06985 (plasmid) [Sinorhizobium meliloti]|nr:hypothetical protein Q1M63_08410 [Sinorhizobium meliloti]WKL39211.1 hypothetical protein Q1M64_06985 [Sinorhizobium meliloti]
MSRLPLNVPPRPISNAVMLLLEATNSRPREQATPFALENPEATRRARPPGKDTA